MIWFYSPCQSNYGKAKIEELKNEYKLTEIIVLPDRYTIKKALQGGDGLNIGFIAPHLPDDSITSLVVVKELPNFDGGSLTVQEKKYGVTLEKSLFSKYGLEATKPGFDFSNVGGAQELKKWTMQMKAAINKGQIVKGAFLLGVTGTGKTHFVEAFAGELDRTLVQLNLSNLMHMDRPVERLWGVYRHLAKESDKGNKFVVLMDEMEKMLDLENGDSIHKQFFGQLLTIMSKINTPGNELQIDAITFATANNIETILKNSPEFLGYHRWDDKFFINYPTKPDAMGIFELYNKIYELGFGQQALEDIYAQIGLTYKDSNLQTKRFVYVPGEINALLKKIKLRSYFNDNQVTEEIISECISLVQPIQKTAAQGVSKQISNGQHGFIII